MDDNVDMTKDGSTSPDQTEEKSVGPDSFSDTGRAKADDKPPVDIEGGG